MKRAACTPKPHKHAEVIKAWADGVRCQFRISASDTWVDLETPAEVRGKCTPAFADHWEYRVKPVEIKTVGYRRYIACVNGDYRVRTVSRPYSVSEEESGVIGGAERHDSFVRWVDTDWQYETV
jgi:hypothetical protein